MNNIRLSYYIGPAHRVLEGRCLTETACTQDGACYELTYRYEQRGREYWAVLSAVGEIMPPATPQAKGFSENTRLPMMENGSYSVTLEAAQRRKEWAAINKAESVSK